MQSNLTRLWVLLMIVAAFIVGLFWGFGPLSKSITMKQGANYLVRAERIASAEWNYWFKPRPMPQDNTAVIAKPAADNAKATDYRLYKVVRGDTLSGIAASFGMRGWKKLHKLNPQIKNPHLIYPDQVILAEVQTGTPSQPSDSFKKVEEVKKGQLEPAKLAVVYTMTYRGFDADLIGITVVEKPAGVQAGHQAIKASNRLARSHLTHRKPGEPFRFKHPGANKFGNRDSIRAANMFNMPEEVKEKLIAKSQSESPDNVVYLAKGDRLEQMVSGNFQLDNNVLCDWKNGNMTFRANAWYVDFQGKRYWLLRIIVCGNWAWRMEEIPPPPAKAPPPPPADNVASTPPTSKAPPTVTDNAAPPPPPPAPRTEVKVEPPAKREVVRQRKDEAELITGTFYQKYYPRYDGNRVFGDWFVATWYPFVMQGAEDSHSFGVAAEGNWWKGETGDKYEYDGLRGAVDGAYRYRWFNDQEKQDEVILRVGVGVVKNEGHIEPPGSGGRFESKQTNYIVPVYGSYEHNRDSRYFSKTRISAAADFDIGGGKRTDTWTDKYGTRPVALPVDDKTMYNVTLDTRFYSFDDKQNVALAGGFRATKYEEGKRLGYGPQLGFDFIDGAVKSRVGHEWWRQDKGPTKSMSADVMVDVSKLPTYVEAVSNLWNRLFGDKEVKAAGNK